MRGDELPPLLLLPPCGVLLPTGAVPSTKGCCCCTAEYAEDGHEMATAARSSAWQVSTRPDIVRSVVDVKEEDGAACDQRTCASGGGCSVLRGAKLL